MKRTLPFFVIVLSGLIFSGASCSISFNVEKMQEELDGSWIRDKGIYREEMHFTYEGGVNFLSFDQGEDKPSRDYRGKYYLYLSGRNTADAEQIRIILRYEDDIEESFFFNLTEERLTIWNTDEVFEYIRSVE